MGLMKEVAQEMMVKWEACIDAQGGSIAEVRVDEDLRATSGDMISRACFGSSYSKGKKIFLKLRTLQKVLSKQNFLFKVPTIRFVEFFIPTYIGMNGVVDMWPNYDFVDITST